jgi:hypothetical protein
LTSTTKPSLQYDIAEMNHHHGWDNKSSDYGQGPDKYQTTVLSLTNSLITDKQRDKLLSSYDEHLSSLYDINEDGDDENDDHATQSREIASALDALIEAEGKLGYASSSVGYRWWARIEGSPDSDGNKQDTTIPYSKTGTNKIPSYLGTKQRNTKVKRHHDYSSITTPKCKAPPHPSQTKDISASGNLTKNENARFGTMSSISDEAFIQQELAKGYGVSDHIGNASTAITNNTITTNDGKKPHPQAPNGPAPSNLRSTGSTKKSKVTISSS